MKVLLYSWDSPSGSKSVLCAWWSSIFTPSDVYTTFTPIRWIRRAPKCFHETEQRKSFRTMPCTRHWKSAPNASDSEIPCTQPIQIWLDFFQSALAQLPQIFVFLIFVVWGPPTKIFEQRKFPDIRYIGIAIYTRVRKTRLYEHLQVQTQTQYIISTTL